MRGAVTKFPSLWRWLDPMRLQDVADRGGGEAVVELPDLAFDPIVSQS